MWNEDRARHGGSQRFVVRRLREVTRSKSVAGADHSQPGMLDICVRQGPDLCPYALGFLPIGTCVPRMG
jgi:hypothetical protein